MLFLKNKSFFKVANSHNLMKGIKTKKLFLLAIIVFLLNLLWEVCHTRLYTSDLYMTNIKDYMLVLLRMSFIDMLIILIIFGVISFFYKSFSWINKPKTRDYIIVIIYCLIVASVNELRALGAGRWTYTTAMPTLFGIGLSPLVQLAVIALIGLWFVRD